MNYSSRRLIYKSLDLTHCTEEYVSWMNNEKVYRFLESGGNYTIEQLRMYITDVLKKENVVFWAIHLKENGKHIGNIKIDSINLKHGLGEYGIMMGDVNQWGKGYAKEASESIIKYSFEELNLRKITLGVVENNESAYRLYKKLGFQEEGILKEHGLYDGVYMNIVRMALFNR